jgi:NAD-dependent dihydropyrimidine dehydrogenase PreA subunit
VGSAVLPEINQLLCTGCGECIAACRPGALALADGKAVLARPDVCEYDGGCEPICPEEAINLPYLIVLGDR